MKRKEMYVIPYWNYHTSGFMDSYLNCLEKLFSTPKERSFTDRTEILEILNNALIKLNDGSDPYQIFSIHGMGGIGKSRLIREFINVLPSPPAIYVSFEIEKSNEVINNLYHIRKALKFSCPFFDFALLKYWEITNPATLNSDFMSLFQKDFFTNMLDWATEAAGSAIDLLQLGMSIPSVLSPVNIIDFMNGLYCKIPQLLHNNLFQAISKTSDLQLAAKLPLLLGIEIKQLISKHKINYPVFIFDSYQESQPYSESKEWLFQLISSIGEGFFVVTSREAVHWNEKNNHLFIHNLESYPEDAARKLIEETITNNPELVDLVIECTQCVPIYIDIALNIYESEDSSIHQGLIDKAIFHDRNKLVRQFVNHLKPSWQSVVLDLGTIRIFNQDIFNYLLKQKMLDCNLYEFHSIIQSNLFNYVSVSQQSNLIKLHDVFCKDVQLSREVSECYTIYKSYLEYICFRRDYIFEENKGLTLLTLFQNAVYLAISLEERMQIDENPYLGTEVEICIVEQLLDIFFTLISNQVQFVPAPYDNIKTLTMRNTCQFIYAKIYEKVNTLETIRVLESIENTTFFGKHKLSFEATLFYTKALAGQYEEFEVWINRILPTLGQQAKAEWFYNRSLLYQADSNMLHGYFKNALASLILLEENIQSSGDYYSIQRTIGHIHRFNFDLEKARNTYKNILDKYPQNTVFREYLITNIIETCCYFPNRSFIKYTKKVLSSMKSPYNIKNKGKVLYSLAIANTVKKHYHAAQTCINKCIQINLNDGYQSGCLFAYMAQAYLDFALRGKVADKTYTLIERLLNQNKVYTYFRLPLALMKKDTMSIDKIGSNYEWINFEHTKSVYNLFLSQLRSL